MVLAEGPVVMEQVRVNATLIKELADETNPQLQLVFNTVGLTDNAIADKNGKLQAMVEEVFSTAIEKTQKQKAQLEAEIEACGNVIRDIDSQLQESTGNGAVEVFMGAPLSLRDKLAQGQEAQAEAEARRERRCVAITNRQDSIKQLWEELVECDPIENKQDMDIVNTFTRDLSHVRASRLIAYEKSLNECKNSRIETLRQSIMDSMSLWDDLGMDENECKGEEIGQKLWEVACKEGSIATEGKEAQEIEAEKINIIQEVFGVSKSMSDRVLAYLSALQTMKQERVDCMQTWLAEIKITWNRLAVPQEEQTPITTASALCTTDALTIVEGNLMEMRARLREHIQGCISGLRTEIENVHELLGIQYTDSVHPLTEEAETMLKTDVVSDEVVEQHQVYLNEKKSQYEAFAPLLQMVNKREAMADQLHEFESQDLDPNRFKRKDSFKILKHEEKMRKLKSTVLPRHEKQLCDMVVEWQQANSRVFTFKGDCFLSFLQEACQSPKLKEKINNYFEKQQREAEMRAEKERLQQEQRERESEEQRKQEEEESAAAVEMEDTPSPDTSDVPANVCTTNTDASPNASKGTKRKASMQSLPSPLQRAMRRSRTSPAPTTMQATPTPAPIEASPIPEQEEMQIEPIAESNDLQQPVELTSITVDVANTEASIATPVATQEEAKVHAQTSKTVVAADTDGSVNSMVAGFHQRAKEASEKGEYNAAIDLYTEALQIDSNDLTPKHRSSLLHARSVMYTKMSKFREALEDSDKALTLSSSC